MLSGLLSWGMQETQDDNLPRPWLGCVVIPYATLHARTFYGAVQSERNVRPERRLIIHHTSICKALSVCLRVHLYASVCLHLNILVSVY